ncbi:hypothetical protein SUGI_0237570 [Cryptomeria japonica]|nr:hypothetical protein SUGI_0237570 [Cryptomeria japonica]
MAVERVSKRLKGWCEEKQKVVRFNEKRNPVTLNLLGSSPRNSPSSSSSCGLESFESDSIEGDLLDLGPGQFSQPGLEKCLDLKTGAVYYLNPKGGAGVSSMSFPRKKSLGFNSIEEEDKRLDLKLNLATSNSFKSSNDSCPKCKGSLLLNFLDGDLSSP